MPDEPGPDGPTPDARPHVALTTIAKEWGRIGCIGFGGPPTHIALLRRLAVEQRGWIGDSEFEDAIAATNLLPGPAAIGAIAGASIPLALAITQAWQVVILVAALALIVGLRRSVVLTLVGAGVIGAIGAALGLPVG